MKKAAMAIMLAALLAATIVGVVWARPNQGPQGQDIIRKVTIPAASFIPAEDGFDYFNEFHVLGMYSGLGVFTAPVSFPTLCAVTVKKVTLSVKDYSASNVCVYLYRSSPKSFTTASMASVCSSGSAGNENNSDSTIDNAQVWPSQGAYLSLVINDTNIDVYGVTIEYQRNT